MIYPAKRLLVLTLITIPLILGAISSSFSQDAKTTERSESQGHGARVKVAVLPRYPRRAQRKGIDGEVTVGFTISRYGRAIDIQVIEESPRKVFKSTVLDALRLWNFAPARPLACGTTAAKATQVFRFRHQDPEPVQIGPILIEALTKLQAQAKQTPEMLQSLEQASLQQGQISDEGGLRPIKRVEPYYPESALQSRSEGVVAMTFLVEKDGSVSNVKVVDAVRGSIFKGAAIRAMRQWQFEPHVKDGKPTERLACHEFIFNFTDYIAANTNDQIQDPTRIGVPH